MPSSFDFIRNTVEFRNSYDGKEGNQEVSSINSRLSV